jgi:calcium-dependent protein kinase
MGCLCSQTPKRPAHSFTPTRRPPAVELEDIKFQKQKFVKQTKGCAEDRYKFVRELGRGTFGKVYYAVDNVTEAGRAIKVIPKGRKGSSVAGIKNEIELLRRLDHPNIVQIYECYENKTAFYIVTEYCGGGELFDYIIKQRHLTENTAAKILIQILSAVAYCHAQGVVHRDLKPENLLLGRPYDSSTLKIADFGTSTIFPGKMMNEKLGTAYYIAPEVLKKKYNEKCDLWSCGVILYILLSGVPPFNGRNDEEIMKNVLKGEFSTVGGAWSHISLGAKNLISKLLKYNPQDRISAAEALQDFWLVRSVTISDESAASVDDTLISLSKLYAFEKLQQGVRTFIASQLVSEDERRRLAKVFNRLDTNRDGRLSREELIAGYAKTMSAEDALTRVDDIMRYIDVDGSGFIEFTEFIAATMQFKSVHAKQTLQQAFQYFDRDRSGKISADEVKQILGSDSDHQAIWEEITKLGDLNGDGEIDIDEFKELITGLLHVTDSPRRRTLTTNETQP